MVKKSTRKWRMCVDYINLHKACPKDAYTLPSIDKLVDTTCGFRLLSFLDEYIGYNQIKMSLLNQEKTTFIIGGAKFCYKVMPFSLKNAGATYQRLMNKVFKEEIGENIKVYVDDMVVKYLSSDQHARDLAEIFAELRKLNMRLNPKRHFWGWGW